MKILNLFIVGLVVALVACRDNTLAPKGSQTVEPIVDNGQPPSGGGTNSMRIYVMDARFSRTTCSTGPGVCFKDGGGNIWSYDFAINPSDGGDVGTIGIDIAGASLHFSFFESLEEDSFVVEQDVKLNDEFAKALGKSVIVLKAGTYRVSYDNYKYGEAYADFVSK